MYYGGQLIKMISLVAHHMTLAVAIAMRKQCCVLWPTLLIYSWSHKSSTSNIMIMNRNILKSFSGTIFWEQLIMGKSKA